MTYAYNNFLPDRRPWEVYQERQRAYDAFYRIGEWSAFIAMWKTDDFDSGYVSRCPTCLTNETRVNQVYQQPAFDRCPQCYGTLYAGAHGGVKAMYFRPSIWQYGEEDVQWLPRGEVDVQNGSVTTTGDVRLWNRDYIIRGDGNRFGVTQVQALHLTTGFGSPVHTAEAVTSTYRVARESESSPVYMIPPVLTQWITLLATDNQRYIPNFASWEFDDSPREGV